MPLDGPRSHILCLDDRDVTVAVHRNRRARRLTLHVDQASGEVRLVLPQRAPLREGFAFAKRKAGWIRAQLDALPPRRPFADGAAVPYLGENHVIRSDPMARRGVWRDGGEIRVSGLPEFLPRRLTDFLKREARRELTERAHRKAGVIDRQVKRISLRDTKSRWGSCASTGEINFSWRLIMAPEPVLDYVVAHEIAHLVHMDHSRAFWKQVTALTDEVAAPQRWLREHGSGLLRYG